jgi:hypothetical protein
VAASTASLKPTPPIAANRRLARPQHGSADPTSRPVRAPGLRPGYRDSSHFDRDGPSGMMKVMSDQTEAPLDRLWREYGCVFKQWDDLTLARWMAQTLGQLETHVWRLSHPLVGSYRLAATLANDRDIWLKRIVNVPAAYQLAECCRAPLVPLFTRDIAETGLICQHCGGTAVAFDDLPEAVKPSIKDWAARYAVVHQVAHWDDRQRKRSGDYDKAFEDAAAQAEKLLAEAATELAPELLNHYTAMLWEDQDECLDVRAEDIEVC